MIKKLLKEKWMWLIYIVLFTVLIWQRMYAFFWPKHPEYFYHQTLMVFSINQNLWPTTYLFTLTSLILNILTIVLLGIYTIDKKSLSISFIISITAVRLISDIKGYSYEWHTIHALFYQSALTSHLAAINLILWILPSYLAMGDYVGQEIKKQNPILGLRSQKNSD